MSLLRVLIDGEALPSEEAIAFWKRFSTWIDEHPGDLAGFAGTEGLKSVVPESLRRAGAVASRSTPQKPYTTAPKKKR